MRTTCYFFLFALTLGGCAVLPTSTTETQRQAVYVVKDDIDAGRFDLADRDADQLVRLFPPPKQRIDVHPIDK